ncbi:MAG: flagellar motor switch protein FliM [Thermodesulfobacteria bacterium]|nr:flagellar motor switch protein FliM [Thermodesulfobacteriota bacterium]
MSQVLSQDEIDALLGGLDEAVESDSEDQGASSDQDDEIIPYDFANATAMSRVKFPGFAVINDHFNRGLRSTLSSILRVMVDSSAVPIEIMLFKDFLKKVPVPSSLHILKMEPLRGHAMLVMDSQLVFCIVEIFLGSTTIGQSRIEGREFTSIEQRLIKRIVNSILKDWMRAWASVHPVKIKYVRSEINPQFAKIIQDEDAVIVCKFQLDIEEMSGIIYVCLPVSLIQPIKSKLQKSFQVDEAEDPAWRKALLKNLLEVPVELEVPLGTAELTGSDILDLEVGDIIQLDTRVDDLLTALIKEQPKFKGLPGIYRGQKALKIEEVLIDE